jgi:hypothetical protein
LSQAIDRMMGDYCTERGVVYVDVSAVIDVTNVVIVIIKSLLFR